MKSKKRLFAFIMAVVTVVSASACSVNKAQKNEKNISFVTQEDKKEEISDFSVQPVSEPIINTEKVEEVISENNDEGLIVDTNINSSLIEDKDVLTMMNETLYEEGIDYNLVIDNYLNLDYSLRNSIKNDYLKAIYMYLLNTDVPMELYINELHNLILLQQVPTDLDEETWQQLFGNLSKISDEKYSSVYDMFFELSKYMHELECQREHYINESFGYSCETLEEYKLVREI